MSKVMTEKLREVLDLLTDAVTDSEKFDRGMDAPGTQLRKKAMDASKLLKELRQSVLDIRKERKENK